MAAFGWLESQVLMHGDVLPRTLLDRGFTFDGQPVRLVGPQGIFKPHRMRLPLSITTTPGGPYNDSFGGDGLLRYRYRGADPNHRDNLGLREAMRLRVPLAYFHGIVPGRYLASWPAFIVNDDRGALTFCVAVDDVTAVDRRAQIGVSEMSGPDLEPDDPGREARRAYITATVRQRLHQRGFRERVLRAYQGQCALCHLRHDELLDAAHILPDGEPDSEPLVSNGIALCKLHHAAFDRYFFAIRPDYTVEVSEAILREHDGPMLRHGLQGIHEQHILLPRSVALRPDLVFVQRRYERFLQQVRGV